MICYHWDERCQPALRCRDHADYWLIQPDGRRNPGGWTCAEHGRATVTEYADKLGELWTLQPIDEHGAAI